MIWEERKRERLIRFIKTNNPFYAFACFDGHTIEQLEKIKENIVTAMELRNQEKAISEKKTK